MGKLGLLGLGVLFLWPNLLLAWTLRCEQKEVCSLSPPDGRPAINIRETLAKRIESGELSAERIYLEFQSTRADSFSALKDADSGTINLRPTAALTGISIDSGDADGPMPKTSNPTKDPVTPPVSWDPDSPAGPAPYPHDEIIAACVTDQDWASSSPGDETSPVAMVLVEQKSKLSSEKFTYADFLAAEDPKKVCQLADAQELAARAAFALCTGSRSSNQKGDSGGPGEVFVLGMLPFAEGYLSRNYYSCASSPQRFMQGEFKMREYKGKCYGCGMSSSLLQEQREKSFLKLKPFLEEQKLKPDRKPRISPIESEGYDLNDFIRPYWIAGNRTIIWSTSITGCVKKEQLEPLL